MDQKKFQDLIDKIHKAKGNATLDLSMEEDLSIAIMNLVSLEEHFYFTSEKTGKGEYLDLLNEVRSVRKTLLAKMINQHEGETWCISKHLLAATMRMIEVGTKHLADNKRAEAKEIFDQAYKIYSLFWALRLKLIDTKGIKKVDDNQLNIHDQSDGKKPWQVEDIVNKLIDCCHE